MIITKVGRRGQLTLPREIRRRANLKDGDHVGFILEGNRVIIQPVTRTLTDLRGSVPVSASQDFVAIRQRVLAARARRVARDED